MRAIIGNREITIQLRAARASGKPIYLWDQKVKGFGARLSPVGNVTFLFEYTKDGKRGNVRRLSIGKMEQISADQARKRAAELRMQVLAGRDVANESKRARVEREARDTQASRVYAEVLDEYVAAESRGKAMSWKASVLTMRNATVPVWGARRLNIITTAEIVLLIDQIKQRTPGAAFSLDGRLRPFFKWAKPRGYISVNPLNAEVPRPEKAPSRDRVLTLAELRAVWCAADQLNYPFGPIYKLLILTGQRKDEVVSMGWRELAMTPDPVSGETDNRWYLSARVLDDNGDRIRGTKNGKPHWVDLSPQALAVFAALPRYPGCDAVFTKDGKRSVYFGQEAKDEIEPLIAAQLGTHPPHWTNHDLRRTMATMMGEELDIDPAVIDRILNHVKGGIIAVYQRQEYARQRHAAMMRWGEFVARLAT